MQTQHAQIAEAAYFLWIEEGRPEGRDADHWTRAQSALDAAPAPAKPASATWMATTRCCRPVRSCAAPLPASRSRWTN